ncbi:MAG: 4Fe-4S dicluster domain-containing protein [Micromonosporaceae bacterium]
MTRSQTPAAPVPPTEAGPASQASGVSRRALLSRLAKLGIATGALTAGGLELVSYRDEAKAASKAAKGTTAGHAWCMVIDLRYCDGCQSCTLACQQRHELAKDQTWIKVYTMADAEGGTFHMPRPCMMCENPPCLYVCPVGATFRTADGLVLVDQNVCIGCRTCMAACPYEARYFNWSDPPKVNRLPVKPTPEFPVPQVKGTVGKCVLCADRLPHGELPACVAGCPMGAIYVGDLVTDAAVNGLGKTVRLSAFLKANDAVRFKEELGTNPRVYYILGRGQNI